MIDGHDRHNGFVRRCVRAIASSFALYVASGQLAVAADKITPSGWLAYGDLRGSFEPCGCDPRTDLGGVARLAAFAARERTNNPEVVLLDLGNNISPPGADGLRETLDLKDTYIVEGLARLNPGAMLPGRFELLRAEWMEKTINQLKAGSRLGGPLPLVLSNRKATKLSSWLDSNVETFRKVNGVAVFGYTWEKKLGQHLIAATDAALSKRFKIITRNSAIAGLRKVLLFSGPDSHLKVIAKSGLFDEIVASNGASDLAKPETPDLVDESKAIMRIRAAKGIVYQTPMGAQGVLRGGAARLNLAKSLRELVNPGVIPDLSTPRVAQPPVPAEILSARPVTWLDRSYVDAEVWPAFFASYEIAVRSSFDALSKKRLEGLKNTPFAGSGACKGCHAEAYDSWVKSKHANAFAILIEKGKSKDAECVSCHVLGAGADGGFVSQEDSPEFMNVHCENCHGPRKAHAQNPSLKAEWGFDPKNPEKICVTCHHPPHSPGFDYKKYWEAIRHGHPPTGR